MSFLTMVPTANPPMTETQFFPLKRRRKKLKSAQQQSLDAMPFSREVRRTLAKAPSAAARFNPNMRTPGGASGGPTDMGEERGRFFSFDSQTGFGRVYPTAPSEDEKEQLQLIPMAEEIPPPRNPEQFTDLMDPSNTQFNPDSLPEAPSTDMYTMIQTNYNPDTPTPSGPLQQNPTQNGEDRERFSNFGTTETARSEDSESERQSESFFRDAFRQGGSAVVDAFISGGRGFANTVSEYMEQRQKEAEQKQKQREEAKKEQERVDAALFFQREQENERNNARAQDEYERRREEIEGIQRRSEKLRQQEQVRQERETGPQESISKTVQQPPRRNPYRAARDKAYRRVGGDGGRARTSGAGFF